MKASSVTTKLYEVRQSLTPAEHRLAFGKITELCGQINARARSLDDQFALIRRSIERQGACSIEEIHEDTDVPFDVIKRYLNELDLTFPEFL